MGSIFCRRCRKTEIGEEFFEKLALTFPPDPNRATYRSKEGGYDLGGFCPREA